jgi:hypothetical protein
VLLGFGWNAMSASVFVSTAVFGGSIRGNLELVGYAILGIAVVHLLAGIGVLLGKSWAGSSGSSPACCSAPGRCHSPSAPITFGSSRPA